MGNSTSISQDVELKLLQALSQAIPVASNTIRITFGYKSKKLVALS